MDPTMQEALRRTKRRRSALKREFELFYMFVFGIVFGIVSALVASFADNTIRGNLAYPTWYIISLVCAFLATLGVIAAIFVSLLRERKETLIMERNFEEMLEERTGK